MPNAVQPIVSLGCYANRHETIAFLGLLRILTLWPWVAMAVGCHGLGLLWPWVAMATGADDGSRVSFAT